MWCGVVETVLLGMEGVWRHKMEGACGKGGETRPCRVSPT